MENVKCHEKVEKRTGKNKERKENLEQTRGEIFDPRCPQNVDNTLKIHKDWKQPPRGANICEFNSVFSKLGEDIDYYLQKMVATSFSFLKDSGK